MAISSAKAEIGRILEHLEHLGLSAEGAMEEYSNFGEKPGKEYEQNELIPVLAPISGTILKRLVSPGTVVTPASDLFLISDLNSLWVNAEVPEKYLALLKEGQTVQITVQAYGEEVFQARIAQVGDVLDPDTRMVQVRCQTSNAGQRLKPEMYANICFSFDRGGEGILIPLTAVHEVRGSQIVFTPKTESQFQIRQIQLGRQAGNQVEVISGLKPGEKVVTSGSFLLKSEVLKQEMAGE
jgi:RND family efflux transporter MFP subunit